jgi:hypothetical protein
VSVLAHEIAKPIDDAVADARSLARDLDDAIATIDRIAETVARIEEELTS